RKSSFAHPNQKPNLTARRSRQHLAQRHEPGIFRASQPLQPADIGPLEVTEVRDGAAERGQPKTQSRAKYIADSRVARHGVQLSRFWPHRRAVAFLRPLSRVFVDQPLVIFRRRETWITVFG